MLGEKDGGYKVGKMRMEKKKMMTLNSMTTGWAPETGTEEPVTPPHPDTEIPEKIPVRPRPRPTAITTAGPCW